MTLGSIYGRGSSNRIFGVEMATGGAEVKIMFIGIGKAGVIDEEYEPLEPSEKMLGEPLQQNLWVNSGSGRSPIV